MTTLTDRLNRLAEDAPWGETHDEAELWARGTRLQRRRRAGGAALVAVLALAIGSLTTLVVDSVSYSVPVADARSPLGLPSAIHQIGEWAPGTDETGPIGPLVAVMGGYRRPTWGEPTFSPAGVSAAGGYAFLDLPDLAYTKGDLGGIDGGPVALSPDGRWVAYYVTGTTTAEPYPGDGDPIVGVALYDTVTGEVRQRRIATERGLAIEEGLTWVGDVVLVEYAQITDFEVTSNGGGYGAIDPAVLRWDAVSEDLDVAAPHQDYPSFGYQSTAAGDRLVVWTGGRGYSLMASDGRTDQLGRLDVRFDTAVFVNPGLTRVATTEDPDGPGFAGSAPSPIVIAEVAGPDAGTTSDLAGQGIGGVVGWRDDRHVIVAEQVESSAGQRYVSVDVESGAREQLLEMRSGATEIQTQIATDALSGPVFDVAEPDFPGNPRTPWAVGAAVVLLLAGNLAWRRRVRG